MPTQDQVVLEAVSAAGRIPLLNRLEAVWRAERAGRVESLDSLAELAGLKRAAFYNLRCAWRANGLAGLVPHDTRSGRRVTIGDEDPLRKRASVFLRAEPSRRNVDIARSIMEEYPSLVGESAGPHDALTVLQRLERLVRDERRQLAGDPTYLRGAFGEGLVLDLTAVSIVLDGDERAPAVAAILMETVSGLVLGSALGRKDDGLALQLDALDAGAEFLRDRKADIPLLRADAPDLGLMLPADVDADRVADILKPHVRELTVGRIGGFSGGMRAAQVVGQRIGRMPMHPRRTLSFKIDEFLNRYVAPIVTLNEGRAIWAREVERHNRARIIALAEAGILDGGLSEGRLAAVTQAVIEALQPA